MIWTHGPMKYLDTMFLAYFYLTTANDNDMPIYEVRVDGFHIHNMNCPELNPISERIMKNKVAEVMGISPLGISLQKVVDTSANMAHKG